MKILLLSFALGLVPVLAAEPLVVDDRSLLGSFEATLGALQEKGELISGATLSRQLEAESKVSLELPKVAPVVDAGQLYEKVCPSVFVVASIYKCGRCDKWHRGGGATAWALTSDGVMVTNHHVFENAEKQAGFGIVSHQEKIFPVSKILAASKRYDVAIFKVEGKGFQPLGLRTQAPVGTDINLISHPDGRFFYYTEGRISRYYRQPGRQGDRGVWMHVTLEYAKGSSGGPIFDGEGRVLAMVSSTSSIYYDSKDKKQRGPFQMVVRNCPTAARILELIESS